MLRQGQDKFKKMSRHGQGKLMARSRRGSGKAKSKSRRGQGKVERQGQGKINVMLKQNNHNHNHNYNLMDFDTIEINLVSRMFQRCLKKFHDNFNVVFKVKDVLSRLIQGTFKRLPSKFQWGFKIISRKFQRFLMEDSRVSV